MKKNLLYISQNKSPYFLNIFVGERFKDYEITKIMEFKFSCQMIWSCVKILHKKHHACVFHALSPLNYIKKFIISILFLFSRAKEKIIIEGDREKHQVSFSFYIKSFVLLPFCIFFTVLSLLFSLFIAILVRILIRKPAKLNHKVESKNIACIYTLFGLSKTIGGHISHTTGVIDGIRKLGLKPTIYSFGKIGLIEDNYVIINQPFSNYLPCYVAQMLFNLTSILTILQDFKKKNPAFIYQRHGHFNLLGVILSYFTGLPFILEVNAIIDQEQKSYNNKNFLSFLVYFYEKICFDAAHRVLSITDKLKEELIKKGVDEERIFVNPNGVDIDIFKPGVGGKEVRKELRLQDKIVVGFSGTFAVWHGTETLKAVALKVLSEIPSSAFLFIGDGPEKSKIEDFLKQKFPEDRLIFTGLISPNEVPAYLDACDILISALDGRYEYASPTKMFEYMAMGKAIICYNTGQMAQIFKNNVNAITVKDKDIEAFAVAACDLAKNEQLRRKLGEQAEKDARNFYTWDINVQRILDSYQSLF